MGGYSVRRTAFEPESAFALEGGAIVRSVGGAAVQRVALCDLMRVRLTYASLVNVDRWVCSAETAGGRIWIPSVSYLGVGKVSDQRAPFRAFVQTLTTAAAAQSASRPIRFVRGDAWSRPFYFGMLVILTMLGVLLALAALGEMTSGGAGGLGGLLLPSAIVAFSASMSWRIWRRAKRGVFDPNALPEDFAGGAL